MSSLSVKASRVQLIADLMAALLLIGCSTSTGTGRLPAVETTTQAATSTVKPAASREPDATLSPSATAAGLSDRPESGPTAAASVPPLGLTPVEPEITTSPSSDTPLEGPLVAFRVEGLDESFYLLVFDVASATFREIRTDLVDYPLELQWYSDGCGLFVRGHIIDLHGISVWQAPRLEDGLVGNFAGTRLSLNKRWLAYSIFSGTPTYDSAEFVDVGIVDLHDTEKRILLTQNGGAETSAFNWSPDSKWLYFSDYDEQKILQVYQASPDGASAEQLTAHVTPFGAIHHLVVSPDGHKLAFAVYPETLLTANPAPLQAEDAAWIEIVATDGSSSNQIRPETLGSVMALWWSADGSRIAFVGESLTARSGTPDPGRQIHWADVTTGDVLRSYYQADAPLGNFSIALAAGDLDHFLLSSGGSLFLYDATTGSHAQLALFPPLQSIFDAESAPFTFPGEAGCFPDR